ncbi:MAG: 30S ribosomal protein S9 [Ignavibacteria bacterium]|nr:30S ribosomal protein S9 [Ignavibacteria bacterium]MBI3766587.1 30S ribosomal protein S9 [Ignavibacteriales bacterium]
MISHSHQTIATGRRKTSVARVILKPGSGTVTINNRTLEQYFPVDTLRTEVLSPFVQTETSGKYDVRANVDGGGLTGQAGAVKLGIARALVEINSELKPKLRLGDMMTRDPRMVERKKYGQKKARKRFQFSKR